MVSDAVRALEARGEVTILRERFDELRTPEHAEAPAIVRENNACVTISIEDYLSAMALSADPKYARVWSALASF